MKSYRHEDVRHFFMRRSWFGAERLIGRPLLVDEYDGLKARTLILSAERLAYLEAFIDGYLMARE